MGVGCCGGSDCCESVTEGASHKGAGALPVVQPQSNGDVVAAVGNEFFSRALAEQLSSADVFRITITSFLDAYNFDVRRLMKCCIHHVLPSGHIVPFCAYNVLYRDGHARLPPLRATAKLAATRP